MAGWDVREGRCWVLNEDLVGDGSDGEDLVLGGGRSLRRCDGRGPDIYPYSLVCRFNDGIEGISLVGDRDVSRRLGEGVDAADAVSEYVPPSDPALP